MKTIISRLFPDCYKERELWVKLSNMAPSNIFLAIKELLKHREEAVPIKLLLRLLKNHEKNINNFYCNFIFEHIRVC